MIDKHPRANYRVNSEKLAITGPLMSSPLKPSRLLSLTVKFYSNFYN